MLDDTAISHWQSLIIAFLLAVPATDAAMAAPADKRPSERPNVSPTIEGSPPAVLAVGQAYSFTPQAFDADGDRLSFWIENQPRWLKFNSRTGELRGTPTSPGSYPDIVIGVSDRIATAALPAFTIQVDGGDEKPTANQPPSIDGTPAPSVVVGQTYSFQPQASDPEGDRLSFDVQNSPAWASFDPSTGRLYGTPAAANVGTYGNIVVSVTDGVSFVSLAPFSVQVADAPNTAPSIEGSPSTKVIEGQTYSFRPSATDADGDLLTFKVTGKPSWANFDTATGRLSGTPGANDVGPTGSIVIGVSDGLAADALPAFTIAVSDAPNRAPVLGGTPPATATVGEPYSFTPSASDPDGDRLTFSIANKPGWASFDAATGRLSGTPQTSQIGFYYEIAISASDSQATTTLPAFTLRVQPPATGSVTLSWQPPTQNENGTSCTDLTGYEVHYGQASGQYTQTLSLPSAALTSVTIENLAPATWYFAVKALNSSGVLSSFSNEASKTIN